MNVHYAKFQKSLIVEQFQGNCLKIEISASLTGLQELSK